MKVDLPEPEGPTMATNSPAWMSSETPRRACTARPHGVGLREVAERRNSVPGRRGRRGHSVLRGAAGAAPFMPA